jgi:hypothetical protein
MSVASYGEEALQGTNSALSRSHVSIITPPAPSGLFLTNRHTPQAGNILVYVLDIVKRGAAPRWLFLRQRVAIVNRSEFGREHLGQLVGDALAHLYRDLGQGSDLLAHQRFW